MAGNEVDKRPNGYPDSWPGVVLRVLELGAESWGKLARVSILLVLFGLQGILALVVWLIASAR